MSKANCKISKIVSSSPIGRRRAKQAIIVSTSLVRIININKIKDEDR